ncbi:hypothetical protein D3C71_1719230 [compost metagenome]
MANALRIGAEAFVVDQIGTINGMAVVGEQGVGAACQRHPTAICRLEYGGGRGVLVTVAGALVHFT